MDLVTFGEAMVRFTPPDYQPLAQASSLDVYVGGSELNVAVLAARLGVQSGWVSRLPDNALGRLIAARAGGQDVAVQVEWVQDARAGLYFVELDAAAPRARNVLYDRAGSAISKVTPGSIDWATVFAGARWFHVSGITPALSDGAAQVTAEALRAAKRAGLTVSYDVNYRSKLWSAKQAGAVQAPLMEHVDVLISTAADARDVFGIGGRDYNEVARMLQLRVQVDAVALTVGEDIGAIVVADGNIHRDPPYEVKIVDRIGAGDAFCGGLIVSRLEHRSWADSLRFATAAAALKHTIPGDFCTVTRDEIHHLMQHGTVVRAAR